MKKAKKEVKIVFVGMGPNQTSWKRGIALGLRLGKNPLEVAQDYCRRLAVTGAIGRKLAEVGNFKFGLRFNGFARRNLNSRWNGKNGKSDKFDKEEGLNAAEKLMSEDFTHYVLLGGEVAKCFGYSGEPLERKFDPISEKEFLLFPHPSGVNQFWNDKFNCFRARKRLREFLDTE